MHTETSKFKQSALTLVSQFSQLTLETITLYIQPRQWFYMRIWNRLNTFCFTRYAYFLTWCSYANTVMYSYLYIIEHIEVADDFIASKKPDLTYFFIIKPRHPGKTKRQIWVEKPAVGTRVTCEKTPATITWSERLKIHCHGTVTQ